MTAANQNPPTSKAVRVTPLQQAGLAVLDTVAGCIMQAASLLGDHMKVVEAADLLVEVQNLLQAKKFQMIEKWQQTIVLAQPGDVPPAPVILSKG